MGKDPDLPLSLQAHGGQLTDLVGTQEQEHAGRGGRGETLIPFEDDDRAVRRGLGDGIEIEGTVVDQIDVLIVGGCGIDFCHGSAFPRSAFGGTHP